MKLFFLTSGSDRAGQMCRLVLVFLFGFALKNIFVCHNSIDTCIFSIYFFLEYLQDLSEVLLFLLLPLEDFQNKPFRYIIRVSWSIVLVPLVQCCPFSYSKVNGSL